VNKGKVHPRRGHEGPEGEWRYHTTLSLISAVDRGGVVNTALVTSPQRTGPSTHCTRGWVGPRARIEGCAKSHPNYDLIPGRLAYSESLY